MVPASGDGLTQVTGERLNKCRGKVSTVSERLDPVCAVPRYIQYRLPWRSVVLREVMARKDTVFHLLESVQSDVAGSGKQLRECLLAPCWYESTVHAYRLGYLLSERRRRRKQRHPDDGVGGGCWDMTAHTSLVAECQFQFLIPIANAHYTCINDVVICLLS